MSNVKNLLGSGKIIQIKKNSPLGPEKCVQSAFNSCMHLAEFFYTFSDSLTIFDADLADIFNIFIGLVNHISQSWAYIGS